MENIKKGMFFFLAFLLTTTINYCSKPCKNLDMTEIDASASIEDMPLTTNDCQINPATELCLDMRKNDM